MTPERIDKDVEKLLKKLKASHEPVFLDVTPEMGAEVGDCFIIARNKVKKEGGNIVIGWQIWKKGDLIEAEAHAVWADNNEQLFDLTPKEGNVSKILFVEDEEMVYEDRQIDSVRLNLGNNPLVDDLIAVCEAIHRFYNLGERADLYDLSSILTREQITHAEYLKQMQEYISVILYRNGKRKSPCPCGSGIAFKGCHGLNLANRIARVV